MGGCVDAGWAGWFSGSSEDFVGHGTQPLAKQQGPFASSGVSGTSSFRDEMTGRTTSSRPGQVLNFLHFPRRSTTLQHSPSMSTSEEVTTEAKEPGREPRVLMTVTGILKIAGTRRPEAAPEAVANWMNVGVAMPIVVAVQAASSRIAKWVLTAGPLRGKSMMGSLRLLTASSLANAMNLAATTESAAKSRTAKLFDLRKCIVTIEAICFGRTARMERDKVRDFLYPVNMLTRFSLAYNSGFVFAISSPTRCLPDESRIDEAKNRSVEMRGGSATARATTR